jgi:hypothetical protein
MEGNIMKHILSMAVVLFLASNWAFAENITLTFREGDGSAYSNTNDAQGNEEYPNYNLESSAYLSAGGPSGYQRVCFVQFPDIIGSNQGQIPPTSTIVSATLTITSTDATNTNISAYRVTEAMVYQPAGGGNGYNLSPSYGYRDGVTTAWSVFGCDGTPSREATPQDTKLVSQGYSGISFNVTSAVQNWTNNPAQNWGLALRGQNLIQGFYSSDEQGFPQYRPKLEVTYTPAAPETETLSFQKGDGGSYSDVEDSYLLSDFPTYTLSASAYLQAGGNTSTRTCSVIRFPNIIGPDSGQIPDGAQIVSAKLTAMSTDARDVVVLAYRVNEYWCETGKLFGSGGQALGENPSWNNRMYHTAWTSPGCGEGSREAEVLDATTVSQGYAPIVWDVTEAVQAWADDRSQNFGICLDAPSASAIQGFYSSDEQQFTQYRPTLEITYVVVPDTIPPNLTISTGTLSHTSPAFVEGTCGNDAVSVRISINSGTPIDVVRRSPTTWYTNVTLSATATTHITVTAKDAAENVATVTQDVDWGVTDIPNWSDVTIREGDSLLLTATGTGTTLAIDSGTGVWQEVGTPGSTLTAQFSAAGIYTVRSRIDSGVENSIEVTAVGVNLHAPIACQVGFMRELEVYITPDIVKQEVAFASSNSELLSVNVAGTTVDGVLLELAAQQRGSLVLEARLGTIGPIISTQEVDEYTLDIPARDHIATFEIEGGSIGTSTVTIRPYVANIRFQFSMNCSQSTFYGGATGFSINTSASQSSIGEPGFQQTYDEAIGEMIGVFEYSIEIPEDEDMYCFGIDVFQASSVEVKVGEGHGVNGTRCVMSVQEIDICPNGSKEMTVTVKKAGEPARSHAIAVQQASITLTGTTNINCGQVGNKATFTVTTKDTPVGKYGITVGGSSAPDVITVKNLVVEIQAPKDYLLINKAGQGNSMTLTAVVHCTAPEGVTYTWEVTAGQGKVGLVPADNTAVISAVQKSDKHEVEITVTATKGDNTDTDSKKFTVREITVVFQMGATKYTKVQDKEGNWVWSGMTQYLSPSPDAQYGYARIGGGRVIDHILELIEGETFKEQYTLQSGQDVHPTTSVGVTPNFADAFSVVSETPIPPFQSVYLQEYSVADLKAMTRKVTYTESDVTSTLVSEP